MKAFKRCLIFVSCLLLFSGISHSLYSETRIITLQEAIDLTLTNYQKLKIQSLQIDKAMGMKKTALLLPNPVLNYYREDLSHNGDDGGESIISAFLPLSFLWTRGPQVAGAKAQVNEAAFSLSNVQRLIKFEVQKAYIDCHFAIHNFQAWQKATAIFKRALKATKVRLNDGDIAGYDHQRIALEHMRYRKFEAEALLDVKNSRKQLSFFLGQVQNEAHFETDDGFMKSVDMPTLDELTALALKKRPDLQAAKAYLDVREAALKSAKRDALPDISMGVGYKRQFDDLNGPVAEIRFELPVFNRNQGAIQSKLVTIDQQNLAVELLEKQITLEVQKAVNRFSLYYDMIELFSSDIFPLPERVLEIAQFSYSEGEMSLIELLDAVRAYTESFQTKNDLSLKYYLSIFELESVTATSLSVY